MLNVLYEDNHIIVVNKKPGEITQGDKTGDEPLSEKIKRFIKSRDQKPGNVFLGTVHRLDRPVSGAIMFAKTSKALQRLNKMFQNKEIEIYREISCDQEVLNTSNISIKNYASMLLELIPVNQLYNDFSLNMAAQQSTLKKRISTMKYHHLYKSSLKKRGYLI